VFTEKQAGLPETITQCGKFAQSGHPGTDLRSFFPVLRCRETWVTNAVQTRALLSGLNVLKNFELVFKKLLFLLSDSSQFTTYACVYKSASWSQSYGIE
jgi:hypothetical protein